MPSKTLADLSQKDIKEGAFRPILFLLFFFFFFFFFFSFRYRRCSSVKAKLALNFSMELNFTLFKTAKYLFSISIVKSQQRNEKKSVKPADLIVKDVFRH